MKAVYNRAGERVKNVCQRGGRYYLRARVKGQTILRASPAPYRLTETIRWRDRFLQERRGGDGVVFLNRTRKKREYCTLGELFDVYLQLIRGRRVLKRSAMNSIACLRRVVGASYQGDVDRLSTGFLTAAVADQYRDLYLAGLDPEDDREAWDRRARSVRSTLTQARSVLAKWAMPEYKNKLVLPDLTDFRRGGVVECNPPYFEWPEDTEVIERTHAEAEKLWEQRSPLYVVYLLCYWCAMRAGEAAKAKWAWVDAEQSKIWVREGKQRRKQGRVRAVPLGPQTLERLMAYQNGEYIVPGDALNTRYTYIELTFSRWMRSLGWSTRKTAHELRRLMGARIYTEHGPAACRDLLGHKRIETVCQYYAALDTLPPALSP